MGKIKEPFWSQNNRGSIVLDTYAFKQFLESQGIYKYYPSNSEGFLFIKKTGNFIDVVTTEKIKDATLKLLQKDGEISAWSMMASRVNYFSKDFLAMIDTAKISIAKDEKDFALIYYKNKAVKVFKDKFELIDYKDLDGFVWKDQVIDRDIELKPESNGIYKSFIWKISGGDKSNYYSFKSVIGFLLHSFKNKSKNRAIIFNDETISDEPNGGSGKGLFHMAIKCIKKVSTIEGKLFNPDKSFVFQSVSPDSQVLLFDDVKKNFNFENLFSVITEELIIETKGNHPTILPFEESPKITITTNYTIQGSGGSYDRRVFEIEMSSYFNSNHTPEDEYGHLLFDDWDSEEWANFDNYMLRSIQFFLANGLVKPLNKNLSKRKIMDATSVEFYDFMEGRDFKGERYYKTDLKDLFMSDFTDYKNHNWFNSRLFNKWVSKYCDYKGLIYNHEGKSNGVRYMTIAPVGVKEQQNEYVETNYNESGAPF